jgi:Spy/CpxP family protein refolding chaperone
MRSNWMAGATGAALALAVVALLGAGMAHSKPGHGSCHGKHGKLDRLEAKLAELDLDTDTRAAAAQVVERARSESEAQREEMRDARNALRELLEQETPAVDQVMAQADALGALQTEAHKAKLRTMLELRALVGSEQWQELKGSLRHPRGERMEKS